MLCTFVCVCVYLVSHAMSLFQASLRDLSNVYVPVPVGMSLLICLHSIPVDSM